MDFNARSVDEKMFTNSELIDNALDLFLQEIDILISTEKLSVYGQRQLGLSIEAFLWKTTFDAPYIETLISQEITRSCDMSSEFNYTVQVELVKGSSKDIGIVTIHIKNRKDELVAQPKFIFK